MAHGYAKMTSYYLITTLFMQKIWIVAKRSNASVGADIHEGISSYFAHHPAAMDVVERITVADLDAFARCTQAQAWAKCMSFMSAANNCKTDYLSLVAAAAQTKNLQAELSLLDMYLV